MFFHAMIYLIHVLFVMNLPHMIFLSLLKFSLDYDIFQECFHLVLVHALQQVQHDFVDGNRFLMKEEKQFCDHIMLGVQSIPLVNDRLGMV